MIKFKDQVPSIYINASRDFQYLSWLFNIVLNCVKHNVDDLYDLPNVDVNSKLTELFALTLGFKVKRNYDQRQLLAIAAILPNILRCKGTEKAVKMAAEALITASGALGKTELEIIDSQLIVRIPEDTTIDTALFLDLLDYILPAGMTCRIRRENIMPVPVSQIDVKYSYKHKAKLVKDLEWNFYYDEETSKEAPVGLADSYAGISSLFDSTQSINEFSANILDEDEVNAGLLSNTVIPVLGEVK